MFDGLKLYLQRYAASRVRGPPPKGGRRRTLDDQGNDEGGTFDHSDWDAVLREHVGSRRMIGGISAVTVDYAGVATNPKFDRYLKSLAASDVEALAPGEQLALLINAYNAL